MKIYLLHLSCDNFPNLCIRIFIVFERIREPFLSLNTHKLFPLGAKSTRESSFGNHEHYFVEKTLFIQGKPPSFGIPINARRPVITPNAFPLLIK
jgi:hypothetical protein